MSFTDDTLEIFARDGTPPLPPAGMSGFVNNSGASIWFASFGDGPAVILLHGGLGHSGNWFHQLAALLDAGYRAILIDSRGHGRSTRDDQRYTYELMAGDVRAVMDHLAIADAAIVGWSDGACTGLVFAAESADRVRGVVFFGCNMDPSGALPFVPTPVIDNCFARHKADYAALSATPACFDSFVAAVGAMQGSEPDYSREALSGISVPVVIVQSLGDEFIRHEHAAYLASSIPGARLVELSGVTHFAPLQRPGVFNAALLSALGVWH